MNNIKAFFLISVLLLFAALSCVLLDLFIYASKPANADHHIQKVIIIKSGQGLNETIDKLHQAGIINNLIKFKLFARLNGYDKKIKAGEYILSSDISPERILEIMVEGMVRLHKLTVPEGFNLHQIALIVADKGFATENSFIRAATDPSFVHAMGIDAETFEGYLFPDTYCFSMDVTPEKIITAMVRQFWSLFTPFFQNHAKNSGFSIHEIMTLASIIEKETGAAFERPIISSVFQNRLKKRMRIESDPTVIYGIKNFSGNLTRKHLATVTPYNTYKIKGLPPGPIANPGMKSIEAVLCPADTRFLYFVSKKDGTHKFSTNIADHNRAVRKYQLRKYKTGKTK